MQREFSASFDAKDTSTVMSWLFDPEGNVVFWELGARHPFAEPLTKTVVSTEPGAAPDRDDT
jgi:hypothetical protein